jgi:hypothetical protein
MRECHAQRTARRVRVREDQACPPGAH